MTGRCEAVEVDSLWGKAEIPPRQSLSCRPGSVDGDGVLNELFVIWEFRGRHTRPWQFRVRQAADLACTRAR